MRRRSDEEIAKGYLFNLEIDLQDDLMPMFIHTVHQARRQNPNINSPKDLRSWVKNLPFDVEPEPEIETV